MMTVPLQQIPRIVDALSQFRFGDELRLLQTKWSQEDFVGYGWDRAAREAGLDRQQKFAFSCLFIAQFAHGRHSVGFYLHQDADLPADRLFLARPDLPISSAMRLFRLNPDLGSDFPCGVPQLLSVVVTYSKEQSPRSHSFERAEDLWMPRSQ